MLLIIAATEGEAAAGSFWGFLGIAIAMALCSKSMTRQTLVLHTEQPKVVLVLPPWEFSSQT